MSRSNLFFFIDSRKQVTFWKALFKGLHKLEIEEERKAKLSSFESVLLDLLD